MEDIACSSERSRRSRIGGVGGYVGFGKVESGPKDPGAVTVLIHRLVRISKSTVDSTVELGSVLRKFPVFLRRM